MRYALTPAPLIAAAIITAAASIIPTADIDQKFGRLVQRSVSRSDAHQLVMHASAQAWREPPFDCHAHPCGMTNAPLR